jgi:hypothetical protein
MLHRENFYVVKNQALGENNKNLCGGPSCTISYLKHVNKWGLTARAHSPISAKFARANGLF